MSEVQLVAGNRFPSINQYTERPQENHLKRFIERNMFASDCLRSSTNKNKENLRKKESLGRWETFSLWASPYFSLHPYLFDSLNCILSMFFLGRKIWKPGSWRPRWDTIKEIEKHEVKWRFAWCNCIQNENWKINLA